MFWTSSTSKASDERIAATDQARVVRGSKASYTEAGGLNLSNARITTPTTITVRDTKAPVTIGGDPNLGAQFAETTQTLSANFANTLAAVQQSANNALAAVLAGSANPLQVPQPAAVAPGAQVAVTPGGGKLSWPVALAVLAVLVAAAWWFTKRR